MELRGPGPGPSGGWRGPLPKPWEGPSSRAGPLRLGPPRQGPEPEGLRSLWCCASCRQLKLPDSWWCEEALLGRLPQA